MAGMRKIPARIEASLGKIKKATVVVACSLRVQRSDIVAGKWAHLGVEIANGKLSLPKGPVLPNRSVGLISEENTEGRVVTHHDLPKIKKQIYCGDRPNYGDWTKGSFPMWQTREVYQRSFIPPRGIRIEVSDSGYSKEHDSWDLVFKLDQSLAKSDPSFRSELLYCLNLLHENTGCLGVHPGDVAEAEVVARCLVSWKIFPPGKRTFRDELERLTESKPQADRDRILARADVISSLKPQEHIIGAGFNSHYYGALLEDDLVVFENLQYGNATYILHDEWERLSKLSRTELLSSSEDFDRLIHDATWEKRLRDHVKRARLGRRRG